MLKNSGFMVSTHKENCFVIFANCMLVKGFSRNAIYDLNGKVFFIDKSLDETLDYIFDKRILSSKDIEGNIDLKAVCEALEIKGVGKWMGSEASKYFTPCQLNWDSPHEITNAILDIEMDTCNSELFISQLSDLACPFLQIRFYPAASVDILQNIIKYINHYEIQSVQILFPYLEVSDYFEVINSLIEQNPRISEFIVYKAPITELEKVYNKCLRITVKDFTGESDCGNIGKHYFIPTLDFYSESLQYNTCLNRKISLTRYGLIKNCPSMPLDYGHIKNLKLRDVINQQEFKSWWFIAKDQISGCKDCEFRHMCSDCRAFILNKHDKFSKPLKCEYNPN